MRAAAQALIGALIVAVDATHLEGKSTGASTTAIESSHAFGPNGAWGCCNTLMSSGFANERCNKVWSRMGDFHQQ